MSVIAGVIAVQGDVAEHARSIERAGEAAGREVEVRLVETAGVVPDCDMLLLPGGESTAISQFLSTEGIDGEIKSHVAEEKPVLATCAGLIIAASNAEDDRVETLDLIDMRVERNAFGRQRDSFEAPLSITGLDEPFPAVFIRAPLVQPLDESGGSDEVGNIEVLASWEGRPVAIKDGPVVGTSFHPELTPDSRLHAVALFEQLE